MIRIKQKNIISRRVMAYKNRGRIRFGIRYSTVGVIVPSHCYLYVPAVVVSIHALVPNQDDHGHDDHDQRKVHEECIVNHCTRGCWKKNMSVDGMIDCLLSVPVAHWVRDVKAHSMRECWIGVVWSAEVVVGRARKQMMTGWMRHG